MGFGGFGGGFGGGRGGEFYGQMPDMSAFDGEMPQEPPEGR